MLALALVLGLPTFPALAAPEHWRTEIEALTRDDASHPPASGGIVFVGSSSIRLWKGLVDDFPGLGVINRGFGGSELADSVHYLDRIVLPYRPRTVVLYAGDNDIASGKTPQQVLQDFRVFRQRVHAALAGTRVVFLSIKESPAREGARLLMREANGLVAADCAAAADCRFVDVAGALLHPDGSFRRELFKADGLHLTREGYRRWRAALMPALMP
jgi:lysophospholipase L1-like esterase